MNKKLISRLYNYTLAKKDSLIVFIIILILIIIVCWFILLQRSENTQLNQINGQPKDKQEQDNEEKNITVDLPQNGTDLSLPFDISGKARVFENMLNIIIKDKNSNEVLYESTAYANAPDIGQFGDFKQTISYLYKTPESNDIMINVLWFSPKDGTPLDQILIPAKLNTDNLTTIKVFFNSSTLDPENSCIAVFPVDRIVAKTESIGKTALNVLLEGQSYVESKQGYASNINMGVKLNSLSIDNGIAKCDFDEQLEAQIGGACKVSAIRAQITKTLMQFPTVKSVIISINGRTEDILQP
jgi:hypothetical protein